MRKITVEQAGDLLTLREAAAIVRCSPSFLYARSRGAHDGPPVIRIGNRLAYPRQPLLEWLVAQQVAA